MASGEGVSEERDETASAQGATARLRWHSSASPSGGFVAKWRGCWQSWCEGSIDGIVDFFIPDLERVDRRSGPTGGAITAHEFAGAILAYRDVGFDTVDMEVITTHGTHVVVVDIEISRGDDDRVGMVSVFDLDDDGRIRREQDFDRIARDEALALAAQWGGQVV
jgi:hypothetical protein